MLGEEPPRLKAATGDMPGLQFGPILANGGLDPGLGLVRTLGELAEIGTGRHVMTLPSRPEDFPELADSPLAPTHRSHYARVEAASTRWGEMARRAPYPPEGQSPKPRTRLLGTTRRQPPEPPPRSSGNSAVTIRRACPAAVAANNAIAASRGADVPAPRVVADRYHTVRSQSESQGRGRYRLRMRTGIRKNKAITR